MFSKQEMRTVVSWLEARRQSLRSERMTMEYGDDFAHSNGKWPRIKDLMSEESAVGSSIEKAQAQLETAHD